MAFDPTGLLVMDARELPEIIFLTLVVSVSSTAVASAIGLPLGALIGSRSFRGKKLLTMAVRTLMGTPTVVVGLAILLLLSRSGPLGFLKLLYTPAGMVIAQVVLVLPVTVNFSATAVDACAADVTAACKGWGIHGVTSLRLLILECRYAIVSAVLAGFARAISEVGSVSIVGGNIENKTRVMTTAISLETGKGNYATAMILGAVLLVLSFIVNALATYFFQRKGTPD